MDAVITYVNGLDPEWRSSYAEFIGRPPLEKRFRDWGTLRYLLRGIQVCLPFVENVYLLVSSDSQVPEWADKEKLHVVRHSDIMPAGLLPVFNSCTIEMFLHRIPGLAEEFIYFNDDMFPLLECRREDFYEDGKGKMGISKSFLSTNAYKKQCRASSDMARKALGLARSLVFVRPQHICSPMLKSASEACYAALEDEILAKSSRLRKPENPNQYLYLDYMYYSGRLVPQRISNKHLSQGVYSAAQIAAFIRKPSTAFACINDVEMSDEKYLAMRAEMLAAFEERFPEKSRFEL
ncbi:MAG: hypothetical protein K6F21_03775 [Bacteroidales bacterium]|nr:hypothetical protein [Bacteroidales bacterium]